MTKFDRAINRAKLLQAAADVVVDAARSDIRYDHRYVQVDEAEDTDYYNDTWLEAHLTPAGQELLDLAVEIAGQIEDLL